MAISELFTATAVTVGATEYSLTNNSTVIAAQTTKAHVAAFIDMSNMAAGDEYEVALQEKARSGGTQRRVVLAHLKDALAEPLFVTPSLPLFWGWDFTLKKIAGTDRAFDWSIRGVT